MLSRENSTIMSKEEVLTSNLIKYYTCQQYLRNCNEDIDVGELENLRIGWKDKNNYWFVSDNTKFECPSNWYLEFTYHIQNTVDTGWHVKYRMISTNTSYYSSFTSKAFQVEILCDENILYERIINNKVSSIEKDFIYNIMAIQIDKLDNGNCINKEWDKCWVDDSFELASQPKDFKIKLFEYQLKSLKWAVDIEKSNYKSSLFSNNLLSLISNHEKLMKIQFDMIEKEFIFDIESYNGHNQITNGGILADEMGLGKTITSIAIISKNKKVINPNIKLEDLFLNLTPNEKLSTKATLIICPSHLTKQWELEIKKCNPNLKTILILTKTNHVKYSYEDILSKDIIITSFQFLWNTSYYVNYPFETSGSNTKITNARLVSEFKVRDKEVNSLFNLSFNNNSKEKVNQEIHKTFTFENLHWHRIIIDEAHEIFKATSYNYQEKYLLTLINSLNSDNRWFVSGTPFYNTDGFVNIMKFLNYNVLKNYSPNLTSNLKYTDLINYHLSYKNIKESIFKKIYIRNTKESVKDCLNIPTAIFETIFLEFSDFEQKLYLSLKNTYNEDYLRRICCNIQICEKFSSHELSEILNFDQVKDKLLADAKDKIEKTQITINSLDSTIQGYAANLQRLKNIISSNEFILKSFQLSEKDNIKEDTCPICRCEFEDPVITQCGHNFCYDCITSVLENASFKKECPICRAKIDNSKVYKLDKSEEAPETTSIDQLTYNYGTKLSKLIKLCKNILNDPNNKIIIFSQWDRLLSMIGKVLKNNEINNVFCKGNVHQRNASIMAFRKDLKKKSKTRIIMLSTENAASGTNLTEATHIIFMEPIKGDIAQIKNMEDQAIGRAVRLGQENQVHVYKLIIKDTIEEDIYNHKISSIPTNSINNNNLPIDI